MYNYIHLDSFSASVVKYTIYTVYMERMGNKNTKTPG